jgi:hypothetical protein
MMYGRPKLLSPKGIEPVPLTLSAMASGRKGVEPVVGYSMMASWMLHCQLDKAPSVSVLMAGELATMWTSL